MASGNEELKVVRCTYSQLKKLAMDLEMQRDNTRKKLPKASSASSKKSRKDLNGEEENQSSDVDHKPGSKTKKRNKADISISNDNQTPKKASKVPESKRHKGTDPCEDREVVSNNKKNEKGLIRMTGNLPGGEIKEKPIRNSKTVRTNAGYTLDSDYDRGEGSYSSSPRLLYDPSNDESPSKYVNHKPSMKRNHDLEKHNLHEMMQNLRVESMNGGVNENEDGSNYPHHVGDGRVSENKINLRKMQRRKAEILFADISYLEADLDNLLSRQLTLEEQLDHVTQLSREIQEKCKSVMLTDLHLFTTKEVFNILWRSGFYHVIERLRGLQKDNQEYDSCGVDLAKKISNILQKYLDNARHFIRVMITRLEEEHNFVLKNFLEKPVQYEGCNRSVKMALLCCHHFMIFLGDIERYKQHLLSVKEWSNARSCYLKASKIAPRNGKPYNQLAVIAVYAKRRLDAVYYYIRSLTVSNPIMTAREKLHAIFDDVQRKAFELHVLAQEMDGTLQNKRKIENGRQMDMRGGQQRTRSEGMKYNGSVNGKKTVGEGRHELWVFYRSGVRREFLFTSDGLVKGVRNKGLEDHEKQEKPGAKISLNEINKQFEVFYLCCHAMLYSKIGIDHFAENHRKVLGLFTTMLRHPTCPTVGMKQLVEIMAINIFEIANMANQDFGHLLEGTPLDLAIKFGSDMFQCLCKAVSEVIVQHCDLEQKGSSDLDLCRVVLANYLPAVKVWFDCMKSSISLFRSSSTSIEEDFWKIASTFLNNLLELSSKDELTDITPGSLVVTLTEDDHLNGFKLLAQASKPLVKTDSKVDKEMIRRRLRIEAIHVVAKFLCEFEDLPLRYDETCHRYYITQITAPSHGTDERCYVDEINEEDIEDDVIVESIEDFDSDSELANPVKELKAKKDALTKEILNQKQREEDTKAVLVEHSSKPTLVLEINPQYLVPDTNCFIDHLSDLQYIAESRDFTIVIPLVVINELDGLAKGTSATGPNQQQRADFVAERSRAAVDFLEYRFSLGDSQMLALTSKGSVLSTIAFRSEEPTEGRGINDDVILSCCTHYCDAKMDVVNKLASADQPFTIRRKVVLLTEDRNLRLKAHVQNIPVISVPQFLEMMVS